MTDDDAEIATDNVDNVNDVKDDVIADPMDKANDSIKDKNIDIVDEELKKNEEAKDDESKDTETDETKKDEDSKDEEYSIADLKLSSGGDLNLVNEELGSEFMTMAKDLNLTQEQAQKLVAFQEKVYEVNGNLQLEQMQESHKATQTQWAEELKQLPNFEVTVNKAQKTLSVLKSEIFKDDSTLDDLFASDNAPFANHPKMTQMFARMHDLFGEDEVYSGDKRGNVNNGINTETYFPGLQ